MNWYKVSQNETSETSETYDTPDTPSFEDDIREINELVENDEEVNVNDIPDENKGGDCYEASGKYIMDNDFTNDNEKLILVHGEVTGQQALNGIRFGHAWVEKEVDEPMINTHPNMQLSEQQIKDFRTIVIDKSQGRNIEMPKVMYYSIGNINPENTIRYTPEEVRRKIAEHGDWGPWDLNTKL